MGYRISWIARSGSSTAELLDICGRSLTGERNDMPDVGWYLLELPPIDRPPRVVLIADGTDNMSDLTAPMAKTLSEGGNETHFFWCSETVMATELYCFKDGAEAWSIRYDCNVEARRPEIVGDVPQLADEILDAMRREQQGDEAVDYIFDLTAEVGRRLIGFRHDAHVETDDPSPFQILSGSKTGSRPWWRFWKCSGGVVIWH